MLSQNKEKLELEIVVPIDFSFEETISYLSRSPKECMFQIVNNKIYKIISNEKEGYLVEISCVQEGILLARILTNTQSVDESMRATVVQYIKEWFDLDTDLQPFYHLAENDILLQKVSKRFYGLRNIGIPDLFEALCWGIIGQQINLSFAFTLKKRFVESFGQSIEWNGKNYWIFPSADKIAQFIITDLTELQMTIRKAEYLIGVAQLMATGKLSKEILLATGNHKEMEKHLVSIRGIGKWTTNYVLMRCLRVPSAFPIHDVGLHNAIKYLLGLEQKPTIEEIRHLASTWTNWESYATFYLWRSLD
jgi:DNA-3-methyladenine glycosylase II